MRQCFDRGSVTARPSQALLTKAHPVGKKRNHNHIRSTETVSPKHTSSVLQAPKYLTGCGWPSETSGSGESGYQNSRKWLTMSVAAGNNHFIHAHPSLIVVRHGNLDMIVEE